jgi:hypothetical protein
MLSRRHTLITFATVVDIVEFNMHLSNHTNDRSCYDGTRKTFTSIPYRSRESPCNCFCPSPVSCQNSQKKESSKLGRVCTSTRPELTNEHRKMANKNLQWEFEYSLVADYHVARAYPSNVLSIDNASLRKCRGHLRDVLDQLGISHRENMQQTLLGRN